MSGIGNLAPFQVWLFMGLENITTIAPLFWFIRRRHYSTHCTCMKWAQRRKMMK